MNDFDEIDELKNMVFETNDFEDDETDIIEHEDRIKKVQEIKDKVEELVSGIDDKEFLKSSLKEIISTGLITSKIIQNEVEINGKGRDAECLSTLLNSVGSAVKEFKNIDNDEEKLKIEHEKLEVKRLAGSNGSVTNQMFVGTNNDMKEMALKLLEQSEEKIIEVEQED